MDPQAIEHRCLEYLLHQTGQMDPPSQLSINALNTATLNWADGPPQHHCHLVVKNGNFTCLSTVRVHIGRYIFHIRTSSHSSNYNTTWLNISDTSVDHICLCKKWKNQQVFHMLHQKTNIQ